MTAVLDVQDVSFRLPGPGGPLLVSGVSFQVEPGEILVLLGRSGSGKTTTLKLVNRLLEPSGGSIRVAGRRTSETEAYRLRRGIGYVIQEVGLFPHFSVAQNIGVVPRLEGWSPERIAARVSESAASQNSSRVENRKPTLGR